MSDPVAAFPTTHCWVSGVRDLSTSLLEVTIGGLGALPFVGGDEFLYVLVSEDGLSESYTMSDFMQRDSGDVEPRARRRVRGAYYTVRRRRPDVGEIDLWVVRHGNPCSVSSWMEAASVGDRLAVWGPRRGFEPPVDARDVLLVADETGHAAVSALVEAMADDCSITAVLECRTPDDRPDIPDHPSLHTVWVDRRGGPAGATNGLLTAVRRVVRSGPDAAFGAAESRHVTAIRRHLRTAHGVPADRMMMTGYWRRGSSA